MKNYKIESNQIKTIIEPNQIENHEWNQVKNSDQKTSDGNDGDQGCGSYVAIGGIVTRKCARDDHDSSGDAQARRRIVNVKHSGFHVMGI